MSSGDVTTYIRGKAQERYGADATFMKDGFDRWAESDAPYRVGGADKMGDDGAGRHRHRSSRAIHKYAEEADEGLYGGGRQRGMVLARRRGRKHRSPSSSSSSSSGSDWSSSSGSMSDSSSSSSASEAPRAVGSAKYRRRHRGGALKCNVKMVDGGPFGQKFPKTECHDDSSSDSGMSSSSGSTSSSGTGSEVSEKGKGRRRHRRGGITPREAVSAALDFFYNHKPNDFIFQGKALADWSSVPNQVKDMVAKIKSVWDLIQANAGNITNIKAVLKTKAPDVASAITKMGFGKRHIGTRLNAKLYKVLLSKAKHMGRKGGDAFDDKLSQFGALGAYNSVKSKAATFDKGARSLYNAYAAVGDNADLIQSTVNAIPKAPDSAKQAITTVTNKMKELRQSGLGKKGKRAPSQRNMMVSKLMREEGLTLGEASKKVSAMLKKGGAL